jgi:hypothetical protein
MSSLSRKPLNPRELGAPSHRPGTVRQAFDEFESLCRAPNQMTQPMEAASLLAEETRINEGEGQKAVENLKMSKDPC